MKLKLRSLETKETTKIEVPTPCSLQHLKEVISQRVSSSSPDSVHLSLNRKDELLGSSPHDSLQSLGIISGDLIFFTFNPNAFIVSSENLIVKSGGNSHDPKSIHAQNYRETLTLEPNSEKEHTLNRNLVLNTQKEETLIVQSNRNSEEPKTMGTRMSRETLTLESNSQKEKALDQTFIWSTQKGKKPDFEFNTGNKKTREFESSKGENEPLEVQTTGTENVDVDDDGSTVEAAKSFSVPCFLRKVFKKEVGEGGDHKLLVIAVHAVLLESGFVALDSVTKMKVEGFYLLDEWPTSEFSVSLWYTLPEIINQGVSEDGIETVFLKFRSLGKYVNVNGSLARNGSGVHRVCLDEDRLSFFLNIMWANCDSTKEKNGKGSFSHLHPEREVFEFWRTIKDSLALPLLIDLCEKAGLPSPPCFMRLPIDLKLKILECLPGVDVAKVGCVCSELRYLSSNDDLWKRKFVEQFGNVEGSTGGSHSKEKFAKSWETRKRRKTAASVRLARLMGGPHIFAPRIIRDPDPLREPRIIGGDYDLGPAFPLGRSVRASPRRNVIPYCDLGIRRH
ncbi:F-box protein SKIP22-like [Actinidia eriantha]|uniref:F-box protein SKIP22-like n=1 Tax=Actinidia eriantha TaxID=165200 RepID=UPI00258E192B|nr:F-box protein SKIP22-like [Actinidia eriantha]